MVTFGISCMHFVGTLSYHPFNQLKVNLLLVWASLLTGAAGTYVAFYRFSHEENAVASSSLIMGLSIGAMHYFGMEAFYDQIVMRYNIPLVLLSIGIAMPGTYLALRWVRTCSGYDCKRVKLRSGVTMGASVLGLHYTAMAAATISTTLPGTGVFQLSMDTTAMAESLGILTIGLLLLVLLGAKIKDRITHQSLQLKTNEQYYQSLYQENPNMVLTLDTDGNFLHANKVIESYGYTEGELLHQSFIPYIVPEYLPNTIEQFQRALQGEPATYESAIYSKRGERFEVSITNIPIIVEDRVVGVYGILTDITSQKKAQKTLEETEAKYRSLAEDALVGTYIIQDGKIVYANQKLMDMFGVTEAEVVQLNILDFICEEDHPLMSENLNKHEKEGCSFTHCQYRAKKRDQTEFYVEIHGSTTNYEGKPAIIGTVIDVTDRKKAEDTIAYMAYHDSLTGLKNRYHFCSQLGTLLADGSPMVLFLVDLDHFKLINDALGHEIGDRMIKAVAERLKEYVQREGNLARGAGDEFLISIPRMSRKEAAAFARRLLDCFADPFYVDEYELYTTPSIGISCYPSDGEGDSEELIRRADAAMNLVKRSGKNNFQFYQMSQAKNDLESLKIETNLRKALERDEFLLNYQPKLDLASGKVSGVEALIRWKHPQKGFISPADFIPLAEKTGLIIPIGEWVLRTACMQAVAWQKAGLPAFEISVNLSVRQLYQPYLLEKIQGILEESGLDPAYLELEITESIMMDSEHALKILNELRSLGIKISLDDFGTGFSSLHYLKEAPITKIKIDQSFVRNCTTDSNDATIVKTIIVMTQQLNLEVNAEGVESEDHLAFLQKYHCNEAQGYYFSQPLTADEFARQFSRMERIVSPSEEAWNENIMKSR